MIAQEQIREALKVSYKEYSNYRHTQFEKWCQVYARKKGLSKRLLVCNEHLYNWYCTQWVYMVENMFYNEQRDYLESNVEHSAAYWELFKDYPPMINGYFPGALLNMIKKENRKTKHYASK